LQTDTSVLKLDTNLIIPNKYQPRKVFDERELNSLAASIKNYGIINPILVRKKDDKYEIIAGERRYRAAKKIGLTEVPVIVKNANEQEMAELALIENLERSGLNPIEEAKSCEEIMRIGNYTQATLANKIGKSQPSIANKLRLLSLPTEIQNALANKKIGERHARCLLSVETKEKQLELLERIMNEKLTVKETEQIIKSKEINEDEIKQKINDIMKSLDIIDTPDSTKKEEKKPEENPTETVKEKIDKKEEKEDDNMNNGNFFPNFDNNNAANNNASLNMMNVQSMNQAPMAAAPEMVMPTVAQPVQEPQLTVPTQPVDIQPHIAMPTETPSMTMNSTPNFDQFAPSLMAPTLELPTIEPNTNMNQMDSFMAAPITNDATTQPTMNEAPQFGPVLMTPSVDNQPQLTVPEVAPMAPDTPLFNPEVVMPTETPSITTMNLPTQEVPPMAPNTFEVPVAPVDTSTINQMTSSVDKLSELQNLLSSNGYAYKVYNNDAENCIIVELPKN